VVDPDNTYKEAELLELSIAERYLRSGFLERRIRGINELKEMYFKVINTKQQKQQLDAMQAEYTKWLTPETFT